MTQESSRIEELRSELGRCKTVAELERKLLAAAPEFHNALRKRTLVGHRADLGLRVISLDMPYQGLAGLSESETLVALKSSPDSIRRRQTLAHECGHGLLRDVDRVALGLSREKEDRLCSWFARRALMPFGRVALYLNAHGFPADVDALQTFCRDFRVSLRAAIAALNEHGKKAGPIVLIAATYRPHEKRPDECDFRVDAAASDPQLFAPRDRRLASMGLRDLSWWAREANPGASRSGIEKHVVFRSRLPAMECWHGPARWSARVFGAATGHELPDAHSLVMTLDRSKLQPMSTDPTRRQAPLRTPALHPQQASLA